MSDLQDLREMAANTATAWFAVLECARNANDFERAATAVRELRRLGVEVRFRKLVSEEARSCKS